MPSASIFWPNRQFSDSSGLLKSSRSSLASANGGRVLFFFFFPPLLAPCWCSSGGSVSQGLEKASPGNRLLTPSQVCTAVLEPRPNPNEGVIATAAQQTAERTQDHRRALAPFAYVASSHKDECAQVTERGRFALSLPRCIQRYICTLHSSDCRQSNPIKPSF